MVSKVYFTDFHIGLGTTILERFEKMLRRAGLNDMPLKGKLTAIKLHFGEMGNLAYLRPNYARIVADVVRQAGGIPFLTDCNTLYVGSRKNAVEHLDTAYANGFSPLTTGCHVIIADGLRGLDEVLIPVNGAYVREAKIGSAIAEAEALISLTHFKGHESTGFGGALKNLGMGSGSRAGKMEMHSSGKPSVAYTERCVGCGRCVRICAHGAPRVENGKAAIDQNKCVGCGRCIGACPTDAIEAGDNHSNEILLKKIDEYTKAVVAGKPCFHIAVVCDVSPVCDCRADNDLPIIPNVGMFASLDPVALDRACVDACNRMPRIVGSAADRHDGRSDLFDAVNPGTDWRVGLDYAEELGLGSQQYELITIR